MAKLQALMIVWCWLSCLVSAALPADVFEDKALCLLQDRATVVVRSTNGEDEQSTRPTEQDPLAIVQENAGIASRVLALQAKSQTLWSRLSKVRANDPNGKFHNAAFIQAIVKRLEDRDGNSSGFKADEFQDRGIGLQALSVVAEQKLKSALLQAFRHRLTTLRLLGWKGKKEDLMNADAINPKLELDLLSQGAHHGKHVVGAIKRTQESMANAERLASNLNVRLTDAISFYGGSEQLSELQVGSVEHGASARRGEKSSEAMADLEKQISTAWAAKEKARHASDGHSGAKVKMLDAALRKLKEKRKLLDGSAEEVDDVAATPPGEYLADKAAPANSLFDGGMSLHGKHKRRAHKTASIEDAPVPLHGKPGKTTQKTGNAFDLVRSVQEKSGKKSHMDKAQDTAEAFLASSSARFSDTQKASESGSDADGDMQVDDEIQSVGRTVKRIERRMAKRMEKGRPQGNAENEACGEVSKECDRAVRWARKTGVRKHPSWYSGLSEASSYKDFLQYLTHQGLYGCVKPCTRGREQRSVRSIPNTSSMALLFSDENQSSDGVDAASVSGVAHVVREADPAADGETAYSTVVLPSGSKPDGQQLNEFISDLEESRDGGADKTSLRVQPAMGGEGDGQVKLVAKSMAENRAAQKFDLALDGVRKKQTEQGGFVMEPPPGVTFTNSVEDFFRDVDIEQYLRGSEGKRKPRQQEEPVSLVSNSHQEVPQQVLQLIDNKESDSIKLLAHHQELEPAPVDDVKAFLDLVAEANMSIAKARKTEEEAMQRGRPHKPVAQTEAVQEEGAEALPEEVPSRLRYYFVACLFAGIGAFCFASGLGSFAIGFATGRTMSNTSGRRPGTGFYQKGKPGERSRLIGRGGSAHGGPVGKDADIFVIHEGDNEDGSPRTDLTS